MQLYGGKATKLEADSVLLLDMNVLSTGGTFSKVQLPGNRKR